MQIEVGKSPQGKRVRVSGYGATVEEAERKARVAANLGAGGTDSLDGTFGGFLVYWRENFAAAGHPSSNTLDLRDWAIHTWLVPHIGKVMLSSLKPEDLERVYGAMVRKGLAVSSIRQVRVCSNKALDHALQRDMVSRNVSRLSVLPPRAKERSRENKPLTGEEMRALLPVLKAHRLSALWLIGFGLGPRPGELCALTWDEVNIEKGTLPITKSRKEEKDRGKYLGDPKTDKSKRTLQLPPPLAEALRIHAERQDIERRYGGKGWNPLGLVFCTGKGTPIDSSNLRTMLARLAKKAGIRRPVPYEMRHTTASHLSDTRIPIELIADLFGHATTRMVEEVYRNPIRKSIDVGTIPLEAYLAESEQHLSESGSSVDDNRPDDNNGLL